LKGRAKIPARGFGKRLPGRERCLKKTRHPRREIAVTMRKKRWPSPKPFEDGLNLHNGRSFPKF